MLLCVLGLPAQGQSPARSAERGSLQFQKMQVSSETYESVGVFDVDGDGHLDVVSGAFWYEGPEFRARHFIHEVNRQEEYWDHFATIPMDVNGDGRMDFITGGWFEGTLFWLENPGNKGPWKRHIIDQTGPIETVRGWDIDGDGFPELIPNTPGHPLAYYQLLRDAEGKGTGKFQRIVVDTTAQGHGLGFGEINGDERTDIIVHNGWLEAPESPAGSWTFHQEFDFADASIPIGVHDVDQDGLHDLIVGQAHDYGLDWYQQQVVDGRRDWIKHPIDPDHSQYHTMEWVDIDGDGTKELITGKRYRAHNGGDPGANDSIGLYYFKWDGTSFRKNTISYGPLGQGKGAGIYFSVADLRKTGRKDIIVAGKDGLYIFFNQGRKRE